MNVRSTLILSAVVASVIFESRACADLLYTINDDGVGNTRITISGSLDLSGGTNFGPSGAIDQFGSNSLTDSIQLQRVSTPALTSSGIEFAGDAGNPATLLLSNFSGTPSGWTADDLSLQVFNISNVFRGIGWDGAFTSGPTAISEDVTYATIPFSHFVPGTWVYGNTTDAIAGNGVTLIVGVPEPSTIVLGTLVLTCLTLRRRSHRLSRVAPTVGRL